MQENSSLEQLALDIKSGVAFLKKSEQKY